MKVWSLLLLSLLVVATAFMVTWAAAQEHDQRTDIYADPVLGPYEFGPARYNTTLYNQRYGRWPGAQAQVAPEDRFNQKSNSAEQTRQPSAYGDNYPLYGSDCALTVDDRFNERDYTRLSCRGAGWSAGPSLQAPEVTCLAAGACSKP